MENEKDSGISRRRFLTGSLSGLAAVGLPIVISKAADASADDYFGKPKPAPKTRKIGPNDTIQFGVIGPGGSKGGYRMGLGDARGIAGVEGCKCVAACDVDAQHLAEAVKEFGPDCKGYKDFRELLSRKDIDAVVIGTPDHWHTIICIAAMKAGKDVYCEKPLTLTIDEGKKLVQVWRETSACSRPAASSAPRASSGRHANWCGTAGSARSSGSRRICPAAPLAVRSRRSRSHPTSTGTCGSARRSTPTTFTERTHGTFRWWLEYSGGMMTDWGAHHNDIAQWGLGTDRTGPVKIEATGVPPEKVGQNCYNTFPEFGVTYTYADGTPLIATNEGENGVHFEGEEGWIFVSRGALRASDQKLLDDPLPANAIKLYESNDHRKDFVDCIRSRKQPICDAEIGHRSVSICHLGNISLRLHGRRLNWDPEKELFINDDEANQFINRPMRKPWKI